MHLPRPDPPNISFTPFQKKMTLTTLFFDLFSSAPVGRELVMAPEGADHRHCYIRDPRSPPL
jgi:hypothetical protein